MKLIGQEDCPGTKLGAFVSHMRKTIKVKCRSDQIPEAFIVDVSSMNIKDNIKIANLEIPEGVVICEKRRGNADCKNGGKIEEILNRSIAHKLVVFVPRIPIIRTCR